jgi:hypothetical protein
MVVHDYLDSIYFFPFTVVFLTSKVSLLLRWLNNSPSTSLEASGSNKFSHPEPFGSGFPQQQKLLTKNDSEWKKTN